MSSHWLRPLVFVHQPPSNVSAAILSVRSLVPTRLFVCLNLSTIYNALYIRFIFGTVIGHSINTNPIDETMLRKLLYFMSDIRLYFGKL